MSRGKHRAVYVVMGAYSEYDSNSDWVESIWTAKKNAVSRAEELNAKEKRRRSSRTSYEVISVKLNTEAGMVDPP